MAIGQRSRSVLTWVRLIFLNTTRNIFKFGTNILFLLTLNWLDFDGHRSKVRVTVTLQMSYIPEHDITWIPATSFFKFGTNIPLHSGWNWLDCDGHRSKVKVTDTLCPSHFLEHDDLKNTLRNVFKFGNNIHLHLTLNWLDFEGQRSRSLIPCIYLVLLNTISQNYLEGISSDLAQTSTWTQWLTE